jgi:ketosteroid isomerase-like protein
MGRIVVLLSIAVLLTPALFANDASADTRKVWSLERAYWQYVKANDLEKYRGLWDPNFLGWPSVSSEPLGKDHITDWITMHTDKGETLQSSDLEPLTARITGNIATTTYRVRLAWAPKNGSATAPSTIRVIHTWIRNGDGSWHIISGMSAPANPEGH